MTCIVGLVHEGTVYLGGDRAGADEYWHMTVQAEPKVFTRALNMVVPGPDGVRKPLLAIGYTTSFRMGQLLRHHLAVPEWNSLIRDAEGWVVHDLIPSIRATLTDGGYTKKENNKESGGSFLLGFAGNLFRIQDDFAAIRALDGYDAIGSGGSIALGALFSTIGATSPSLRVSEALKAAEHHSAGVRGPFDVIGVG